MKQRNPKDKLILEMMRTFDALGSDFTARIDARVWYEYFLKKLKILGIKHTTKEVTYDE